MTYTEINSMMESFNIPCAYYEFTESTEQAPAFLCYYFMQSDDLFADNENYARIRTLMIELYTVEKNFDLEESIEDELNRNGLTYIRDETYLGDERMFMITYTMEVLINA